MRFDRDSSPGNDGGVTPEHIEAIMLTLLSHGFKVRRLQDGRAVFEKGDDYFYFGYEERGDVKFYYSQGVSPLVAEPNNNVQQESPTDYQT